MQHRMQSDFCQRLPDAVLRVAGGRQQCLFETDGSHGNAVQNPAYRSPEAKCKKQRDGSIALAVFFVFAEYVFSEYNSCFAGYE